MTNLRSLATALFVLLAPAPLFAGDGDEPASVRILPGWQSAEGHHFIGVEITLEPGWKTYWRAPGEAGIPPYWDWSGSENVADLMIHWPVPEVFEYAGMDVIGYHDQVVIPIEIRPSVIGSPARLSGHGEIGVCQEICVPFAFDFALVLKEGGRKVPAIIAAMIDQPVSAETAKVEAVTCLAEPTEKGLKITAKVAMPSAGSPEIVVIEAGDGDIWVSGASSVRDGVVLTASAEMINLFGDPIALNRSAMRITVLGSERAVDILGCPGG